MTRRSLDPSGLDGLARRARGGDARALRRLLETAGPIVHRTAWRILGDAMLAADAMQEALLKAVGALGDYDPARPVRPWLQCIAGRAALGLRRKETVLDRTGLDEVAEPPAPARERPDEAYAARRNRDLLTRLAGDLSARQRTVFVLRDLEDQTVAEVAAALEMTPSTVRVHLARARERLRDALRRLEAEEVRR